MFISWSSPCLIMGTVSIITMRTDMVIRNISKFLHCLIQRLLCLEIVQIDAFIFQCVEISFYKSIVVWASCFAHTLTYMGRFTELHKCFWRILRTLIAVKNQFFPDQRFCCVFPGIIIRLPVLWVVVISIRADARPPQQPADAKFPVMLFNKPISL